MKKYVVSFIAGVLLTLLVLLILANIHTRRDNQKLEYICEDYISNIEEKDCFLCSAGNNQPSYTYWGEDNVGIINLNTFEVLRIEINRYDDFGNLIKKPAGYMSTGGLYDDERESSVHGFVFPDNGYAQVQISGLKYQIDRKLMQNRLCQKCLDVINEEQGTDPLAEYAVIGFEDGTIQPLIREQPWFAVGSFGVDCEFKEDGAIDLLIHDCANRYGKE